MNILTTKILSTFLTQGVGILNGLKKLPWRNVSVRVVTSEPTVQNNSTDLNVLRENGEVCKIDLVERVRL